MRPSCQSGTVCSFVLSVVSTTAHAEDHAFSIEPSAGDYSLTLSGQHQSRYTLTSSDDPDQPDDTTNGFTAPRTALRFDVGTPGSITLGIQANFDSTTGTASLEEAAISFDLGEGWGLTLGTTGLPVLIEDAVYDYFGQAVDQSLANLVFAQGDSQGVILTREDDSTRFAFALSDGLDSIATDFSEDATDYAFTARADGKSGASDWSVFDEFPSPTGSEFAWRIGGALHYEAGTTIAGHRDLLQWTADLHLKGDGWNLFAAYVGRASKDSAIAERFTDHGAVVQGGMFITESIEPFARFDTVIPDPGRGASESVSSVTLGANWYIHGHAFKCTLDCVHLLDPPEANGLLTGGDSAIGLLADDGEQTVIRFQIQLLF